MRPCSSWLLVSLLAGCVSFQDPLGPVALDYRIDRPRIAAVRLDPPLPVQGQSVTVDALVLSPVDITGLSLDVCATNSPVPVEANGSPTCFDNPDLVTFIADELPSRWDVPVIGADCEEDVASEDTGGVVELDCTSEVPLRVQAFSEDEVAGAILSMETPRQGNPPDLTLWDVDRSLEIEGRFEGGEQLSLVYRIDWDGPLRFRWYVDDGELHYTGRTATTWFEGGRHTTRNQLTIPRRYEGPLRIVVVAVDDGDTSLSGHVTWDVTTLEVR